MTRIEIERAIIVDGKFNESAAKNIAARANEQETILLVSEILSHLRSKAMWADRYAESIRLRDQYIVDLAASRLRPNYMTGLASLISSVKTAELLLDEMMGSLEPTAKLGGPNVAPPLTDNSEDALVLVDNWLRGDMSPFILHVETAKQHLDNLEAWVESLGPDFEDLQDMVTTTRKEIRGWDLSNQKDKLAKIRTLVDELGAVYLELQTPVQDLREQALKMGSPTHVMLAYIDQLVGQKKITAAEAKRLKGILGDFAIEAVAKVKLRNELKKI